MKLFYTEQSLASLQECLDFFPPEVPANKVNEIRDRILAKADKLLADPYIGLCDEETFNWISMHVLQLLNFSLPHRVRGNRGTNNSIRCVP